MEQKQPALDPKRLVFLDKTGLSTKMTRLYGRASKGGRCLDHAPRGRWKATTFAAGLRCDGITALLVLDGAMDGRVFLTWVRDFLRPTSRPGDLVVADNLSSHRVTGARAVIEDAGARLEFLPPYSPDLNPIERMFAKLKALLRKAKERGREALWKRVGKLLGRLTPQECSNYFASSGYGTT